MSRSRTFGVASLLACSIYLAAYVGYRQLHTEVWVHDGHQWLIFGSATTYYLFRPLRYLDGWLTGMRFHIGPHLQTDTGPSA